jgi:hypothetical protein
MQCGGRSRAWATAGRGRGGATALRPGAIVGLAVLLAAAACKREPGEKQKPADAGVRAAPVQRSPETAVLTRIAIRWTEPAPAGVDEEDLSRRLGALLTGSPAFVAEGEPVPAGRVAVPAAVEVTLHRDEMPRGAERVIMVGVEAEVGWMEGADRVKPRENVLVHRPLQPRDRANADQVVAALAIEAIEAAGRGLVAKETMRQGDDAAVLAGLSAPDPDQVLWALEIAAARRLSAAFDRAIALLDSPDAGVSSAALRVLVALRDARAVRALARRADFADPDTMRGLVEAVTAIGGPEAIEFLELVASGHADADMRQRAQEGLERLGRRRP